MADWKDTAINDCLTAEEHRKAILDADESDLKLVELKRKRKDLATEIDALEKRYITQLDEVDNHISRLHHSIQEGWDIPEKTYKCNTGSATIRTTRALKIDNKEMLISILQHIGKLTQCIKGWDLTYLRKLADAGLFDVEHNLVVHYDEKWNVIISAVKNDGSGRDEE